MKLSIFILTLLVISHVQAKDIYRWTDSKGVTHYSFKAPDNVAPNKVKKMNMSKQSKFVEGGTINPALNQSEQEQELDRITKKNCDIARKNIKILTAFSDIQQKDANGKLQTLSKSDKTKQLSLAKKQAALFCVKKN